MKFTFVITEAENFAVMLFSRLLKDKDHQAQLIFDPRLFATDEITNTFLARLFDVRKQNLELIKQFKPDYCCFSTYTQDYRWNIAMAERVKQALKTTIIFGGIHCVLCASEVIKEPCVDAVCVGEGEQAVLELAGGKAPPIANLWFKGDKRPSLSPLIKLDDLPLPDRDSFYAIRPIFKQGYTIATSRGCPYNCSFCASAALNKHYGYKYLRQRSPHHVVSELLWAQERYNPRTVYFTDDNLTLNTDWLTHFAKDYADWVGLPFYCTANPATIKPEQIELLATAGCQMIGFGLQSANEEVRTKLLNRGGSNERIVASSRLCKRFGIRFSFDYISGIRRDERADELQATRFFNQLRPDLINTFQLVYLPSTKLTENLSQEKKRQVEEGKLKTSMFERSSSWFVSMCSVLPLLPRWLVNGLLASGLYRALRLSYIVRMLCKNLKRLLIGRSSDALFPIQLLLVNIVECIKLKRRVVC